MASWRNSRKFGLPIVAIFVVIGSAACANQNRLQEPFASLFPSCEQTNLAPDLTNEGHTGDVTTGSSPLSINRWARSCEGTDFEVHMSIREYGTEADAEANMDQTLLNDPTDWEFGIVFRPSYPVDDFGARERYFLADYGEVDGYHQAWLQFRRGRYVGSYSTSAGGRVVADAAFPFGWVVEADSHTEITERLVNETLSRWTLK